MALTVDALHPAYERVAPQRERLRLTYSGTDAVKGAGTAILPMLGAATDPNAAAQYQAYQQRAYFLGAMPRTVEGISGLVFRNPPTTTLPMRSRRRRIWRMLPSRACRWIVSRSSYTARC